MIRPVPFLFIAIASLIVGCDEGANPDCGTCGSPDAASDPNDTACSENCDSGDDTSINEEPGYLNVKATVLGTEVQSNVIINGKVVGITGEDIELSPGDYTFTIGDDPKVMSTNGLPIYQSDGSGQEAPWNTPSQWISPTTTVTISPKEILTLSDIDGSIGDASDDAIILNILFTEGRWTVDTGHSMGTDSMTYASDGRTIKFPKVNEMTISGITLTDVDFPDDSFGAFQGPDVATVSDTEGSNYYGWFGEEDDDPRTSAQ